MNEITYHISYRYKQDFENGIPDKWSETYWKSR